jgi:glucose/arabinose dehydrogenase
MKFHLYFFALLFSSTIAAQNMDVDIELFANGFNSPLGLKTTGVPGDDRLFVVEKGGTIQILNPNGTVNSTPFLDISSQVTTNSERGLLGLAFHPDFGNNSHLYVYYTDLNGDTQISRFTVDGVNPNDVIESTEQPILSFSQPASNHNGGCLQFGLDGYLYIASGDGGGSPETRAQDLDTMLGKILRIDVDNPSNGNNYGIPSNNPFVSDPNALDEIWAYGLRNPWKFSFDTVDGHIWIGDVGQEDVEEIDRENIMTAGLNYGWPCFEGSQPYNNTSSCPPQTQLAFPYAEYSSDSTSGGNCSVTGGYVYRGSDYPNLQGLYFFADFCSGMIGTIDNSGNITDHGNFNGSWSAFGTDMNGELYIVDIGGSIYKIKDNLDIGEFEANDFVLYPNPASETFTVVSEGNPISKISVFDLRGNLVLSNDIISTHEQQLSVSGFENGVYIVKIQSENGKSAFRKLVVWQ